MSIILDTKFSCNKLSCNGKIFFKWSSWVIHCLEEEVTSRTEQCWVQLTETWVYKSLHRNF